MSFQVHSALSLTWGEGLSPGGHGGERQGSLMQGTLHAMSRVGISCSYFRAANGEISPLQPFSHCQGCDMVLVLAMGAGVCLQCCNMCA